MESTTTYPTTPARRGTHATRRTSRMLRRYLCILAVLAATIAAAGTAPSSARAGSNGFPAWPGTISCGYGLPQVSVHMPIVHGLNTTNYFDYQKTAWMATVYESVNGVWQKQISPAYSTGGWVSETSYVQQWFLPSGAAVSPSADFYTFRLSGSRYIYVTYEYWWNDYRTGQVKYDYTQVGPIQC